MEKKERVLNRCRNCGHRPGLSTIPPWTVAECGICKQIQSAANYPELVKRWNEANPKGEPDNGAKPEPIWTALEGEPEFNLAPESEPVLPKNSAANPCKCGGDVIYFQTIGGEHWFICSKCGQKLSSKISYMDLVAKWNEANPNLPPGWSHATAFSTEGEIHVFKHGGPDPEPGSRAESEPKDKTDPLSYQVGGSHYSRYKYQPIEFFNDTHMDFNRANAIKYLTRWKDKGGVEDLRKAVQYLRFAEQERDKEITFELQFLMQFGESREGEIIDQILDRCVIEAREAIEDLIDAFEANAAAQEDESET